MKRKVRQQRPRTVEQIKLHIKQEWEWILPVKLQQLMSSVPKPLSVVKRKGGNGNFFLGSAGRLGMKFKMTEYLQQKKETKFNSSNIKSLGL